MSCQYTANSIQIHIIDLHQLSALSSMKCFLCSLEVRVLLLSPGDASFFLDANFHFNLLINHWVGDLDLKLFRQIGETQWESEDGQQHQHCLLEFWTESKSVFVRFY